MRLKPFLIILLTIITFGTAAADARQPAEDLKKLVRTVTGESGTNEEKTRKLVTWINTNFTWSYTDYQKRTVEEIIERRAGNCAELANVLAALLKHAEIPFRWAAEINIQPEKPSRQETAARLVKEKGKHMSVFGLMHNDHVWLEVLNEKDGSWIPADPAVGVVGLQDWVAARLAFRNRTVPVVPEVAEVVKDMLVPFVVVIKETRGGDPVAVRSEHYLVDGLDDFYGKRLSKLPEWTEWTSAVKEIGPLGMMAFAGEEDLHQHGRKIERAKNAYDAVARAAAKK